ncbi:MAG: translation initiation factor IF-2 associated domain-containing protein, partial [Pseudomonadota bacterium]
MADVTVGELAKVVGVSVDRLLSQVKEAGLPHTSPDDPISNEDKNTLLLFLRRGHGGDKDESGPKKITLKRKTVGTLKSTSGHGRGKTVNVEVRKKRTYVKRSSLQQEREAEEAAAREAEEAAAREAAEKAAAEEAAAKAAETPEAAPDAGGDQKATDGNAEAPTAQDAPADASSEAAGTEAPATPEPVPPVVEPAPDKGGRKGKPGTRDKESARDRKFD